MSSVFCSERMKRSASLFICSGPLMMLRPGLWLLRCAQLKRFPNLALLNTKRSCLIHAGPPLAGCPRNKAGRCRPFGPAPLQRLQPYYERLRPCAPHRYAPPCRVCLLGLLPSHRDDRFPRSSPEPDSRSRRLHAGRRLGSTQVSPNLVPGPKSNPGFDVDKIHYDTSSAVHSRSSP